MNKAKSGLFKIIGINENYMGIKILKINEDGRYFNKGDDENTRNVTIIGENVSTTLFNNQKALGKSINIAGIDFKVIGVLKNDDIFSASEINSVYVPFSSYINCIDNKTPLRAFCLYLNKEVDSKRFENELRAFIANKYQFAYSDKQALQIINFETQTSAFEGLFDGLKMFIWIVGICFLISGIVGVSNIMFVVIKERSSEIGIRKAVGATPKSILVLMLTESVIITVISGIIGLISGAAILEIINWLLESARHANDAAACQRSVRRRERRSSHPRRDAARDAQQGRDSGRPAEGLSRLLRRPGSSRSHDAPHARQGRGHVRGREDARC